MLTMLTQVIERMARSETDNIPDQCLALMAPAWMAMCMDCYNAGADVVRKCLAHATAACSAHKIDPWSVSSEGGAKTGFGALSCKRAATDNTCLCRH